MSLDTLEEIANYIVSDGKGILAADESNPTCGKRFDSIGVESTEKNRRDYREMLFRSEGMKGNIGGVILFDETIRQNSDEGPSLVNLIVSQGALPGIKVDQGLQPLDGHPEETLTQGLEGLEKRCDEYFNLGAKFTKWRAVIKIGDGMPSDKCIEENMQALADYAKTIDQCLEVSKRCLNALFGSLKNNEVNIAGTILKPNMITSGSTNVNQAGVDEVAEKTLECLKSEVPSNLPGITFLSGGQSDLHSTAHLDAMNKIGGFDWRLSFSYGRALQQSALKAWLGKEENRAAAQLALSHRAFMNSLASKGEWNESLEK
jgi:fructose-bisphosphate aldolase class I